MSSQNLQSEVLKRKNMGMLSIIYWLAMSLVDQSFVHMGISSYQISRALSGGIPKLPATHSSAIVVTEKTWTVYVVRGILVGKGIAPLVLL